MVGHFALGRNRRKSNFFTASSAECRKSRRNPWRNPGGGSALFETQARQPNDSFSLSHLGWVSVNGHGRTPFERVEIDFVWERSNVAAGQLGFVNGERERDRRRMWR